MGRPAPERRGLLRRTILCGELPESLPTSSGLGSLALSEPLPAAAAAGSGSLAQSLSVPLGAASPPGSPPLLGSLLGSPLGSRPLIIYWV